MAEYKKEYSADLVEYFNGYCDGTEENAEENVTSKGSKSAKTAGRACAAALPSFTEFARRKGVLISDIERWRREQKDFERAYAEALECQRQLILQGVLDGRISPTAARFYLDERGARAEEADGAGGFKITVSFEGEDDGDG